jgi:hypothetical protein
MKYHKIDEQTLSGFKSAIDGIDSETIKHAFFSNYLHV